MKTNCKIFKSFCLALSISVFNLHFVSSLSFASGPNSSSNSDYYSFIGSSSNYSSTSDSINFDDSDAIIPDSSTPSSSTFSTIANAEVVNPSQPCSSNSTTIVNNFINNTTNNNTTST